MEIIEINDQIINLDRITTIKRFNNNNTATIENQEIKYFISFDDILVYFDTIQERNSHFIKVRELLKTKNTYTVI